MNELRLLQQVLPLLKQNAATLVGPGDDCAVIQVGGELLLLAVDQVIAGVHYRPDTAPEAVAAKLLKRNLSDIAAMGGTPFCALLTLAGNNRDESWYLRFFRGLAACAEQYNVSVSGGDLAVLPPGSPPEALVATLTITGKATPGKLCRRNRAMPGQTIMTTGQFGLSFSSGHHLDFTPRLAEAAFLAGTYTNCMIDVSDGLLLDASRLAAASGVGMIFAPERIPRRNGADLTAALSDGEDYELVFTVNPAAVAALRSSWPFTTPLTAIGTTVAAHPGLVFDENGVNLSATHKTGYEHTSE
ncbi:MAG: thiamine-phosphate kinase [Victivallales bacterium]|nr:thiamine-phosphate kinase [Victivallales bacterium]